MDEEHKGTIGEGMSPEYKKQYQDDINNGCIVSDPSTFDWATEIKKPKAKPKRVIQWDYHEIVDFYEKDINIDVKVLRYNSSGDVGFKLAKVVKIDLYAIAPIGVITDGNTKIGWTYPHRLIVQE